MRRGNLWLFGGGGYDSTGKEGVLNDVWKFTPSTTGDTGEWTWMVAAAQSGAMTANPESTECWEWHLPRTFPEGESIP